ncbi:MAG: 4-hydroxy-tetrahydrodipicolinate reductase [Acidimicrobiales bacterium]|jgi:4-hydroxy-tetrahydrodipicolinate reductase
MLRVGVFGAAGRMGAATCAAVLAAADLELVVAVDPAAAGRPLDDVAAVRGSGLEIAASPGAAAEAGAEVMVDFTVAQAAREDLRWCADHGVHAVCGTTGFGEADLESLRAWFSGDAHAIVAPNFSIGAALMMRCAELCAPWVAGAEIVELHHDRKRDAPSGTSLETIRRMQAARDAAGAGDWAADPTEKELVAGARGGRSEGGLHVHSVRLPGFVAHQEVIFGLEGEILLVRHDSLDRASFMPGVLLAVRRVAETAGLTVGLAGLLGL